MTEPSSFCQPLVSVVMLAWNRKKDVRNGLSHLSESTYQNMEVIVVDNASTDGTSEMIRRDFPHARLIQIEKNIGIGGFNVGFANAKGEYIVVLDDDSYPEKDAIARAVKRLQKDDTIPAIAGNIILPQSGGFGNNENWPSKVGTFIGCGAVLRREVIQNLGGYDEYFFLYINEIDLATRIVDKYGPIRFFKDISFVHNVSFQNRVSGNRIYYCLRNKIWYLFKYYPIHPAIFMGFRTGMVYLFRAIKFKQLTTYLAAIVDAISKLKRMRRSGYRIREETVRFYLNTFNPEFMDNYRILLLIKNMLFKRRSS